MQAIYHRVKWMLTFISFFLFYLLSRYWVTRAIQKHFRVVVSLDDDNNCNVLQ